MGIGIHEGKILLTGDGEIALGNDCCCECPGDQDCQCCCCDIKEIQFIFSGITNGTCDECESKNGLLTINGGPFACGGGIMQQTVCAGEDEQTNWAVSYDMICPVSPGDTMTFEVVMGFENSNMLFFKTVTGYTSPGDCGEALNGNIPVQDIGVFPDPECDVTGASVSIKIVMEITPDCAE